MTEIRPAPKHLAMLAQEMRGPEWGYEETRAALIACSEAGWTPERIYRETFRLLLSPDATPNDLRLAARDPRKRDLRPGAGLPTDPETIAALAEYRARVAAAQTPADDEPEGGRVA